jgi:hypothetical protein
MNLRVFLHQEHYKAWTTFYKKEEKQKILKANSSIQKKINWQILHDQSHHHFRPKSARARAELTLGSEIS